MLRPSTRLNGHQKTAIVNSRVTPSERAQLVEAADRAGLTFSEWIRKTLLAASVKPVENGELSADQVALLSLEEIQVVRFLLGHVAQELGVNELTLGSLYEKADAVKRPMARTRIEASRRVEKQ